MQRDELIVVTGATGRQGCAVVRHLLADGWRVRGLTRNAGSDRAGRLADEGAEVRTCDLTDREALARAFEGAHGVFSVQNPMIAGLDGEVAQGRNVAEAAHGAEVSHLVYGAAGMGHARTGVGSWGSKVIVAEHTRSLGVPLTVLRPTAFMELMTDKDFYPPVSTWHLMPKVMGADRALPWLCADDLGAIAARAFAEPDVFVGADIGLAADLKSIDQCREVWRGVTGRRPRGFPMPVWLFRRFVGDDLLRMWAWLHDHEVPVDPAQTRELLPGALTVEQWVRRRVGAPDP